MSVHDDHYVFTARLKVRDVAMSLARAGLSDDTIREALRDIAETEAERAIEWGHEEDERQRRLDDLDDIADESEARRAQQIESQEER